MSKKQQLQSAFVVCVLFLSVTLALSFPTIQETDPELTDLVDDKEKRSQEDIMFGNQQNKPLGLLMDDDESNSGNDFEKQQESTKINDTAKISSEPTELPTASPTPGLEEIIEAEAKPPVRVETPIFNGDLLSDEADPRVLSDYDYLDNRDVNLDDDASDNNNNNNEGVDFGNSLSDIYNENTNNQNGGGARRRKRSLTSNLENMISSHRSGRFPRRIRRSASAFRQLNNAAEMENSNLPPSSNQDGGEGDLEVALPSAVDAGLNPQLVSEQLLKELSPQQIAELVALVRYSNDDNMDDASILGSETEPVDDVGAEPEQNFDAQSSFRYPAPMKKRARLTPTYPHVLQRREPITPSQLDRLYALASLMAEPESSERIN